MLAWGFGDAVWVWLHARRRGSVPVAGRRLLPRGLSARRRGPLRRDPLAHAAHGRPRPDRRGDRHGQRRHDRLGLRRRDVERGEQRVRRPRRIGLSGRGRAALRDRGPPRARRQLAGRTGAAAAAPRRRMTFLGDLLFALDELRDLEGATIADALLVIAIPVLGLAGSHPTDGRADRAGADAAGGALGRRMTLPLRRRARAGRLHRRPGHPGRDGPPARRGGRDAPARRAS